jgi:serine/threonine protein phosphatase PrpC
MDPLKLPVSLRASPRYECVQAFASNRTKSQDTIGIFERDDVLVVVLADGGGGLRGGEAASRCLVAVVESVVKDPAFALDQVQPWFDVFRATDSALAANGTGETTGTVVVLGPRGIIGVSAGDSEAWIVTPTRVDDLTVGQQTRQRLGGNRVIPAAFGRATLPGILVVASDGLFKYAAGEVIARLVRASAIETAAEHLVELVRLRSGKVADDVAVVLVRTAGVPADLS